MSSVVFVNVAAWVPDQVADWLKGAYILMYSSIDTGGRFRWEILNPSPETSPSFDRFEQKGTISSKY